MEYESEPNLILPNVIMPEGIIMPEGLRQTDANGGGVGPFLPASSFLGVMSFSFSFFNVGGSGNLPPGRSTIQNVSFQGPDPYGAYINLTAIRGAFVRDGNVQLTERPLGEFSISVGFINNRTISCKIRLSDSNSDDPISVNAQGVIVFFR